MLDYGDYIALGAFLLSLILALGAFIYWLINVSYKINKFIFDLKGNIDEIKEHSKRYDVLVQNLNRKVDYLKHILVLEFPQYFRKQKDETDN
jgi:hypothetical protein